MDGTREIPKPTPPAPEQALPHRGRWCCLDEIVARSDETLHARVHVGPRTHGFEPGRGVPAWIGIEFMAQAASAWGGVEQFRQGRPVTIGLLVGTRRYRAYTRTFDAGSTLDVHADALLTDEDAMVMFDCRIDCAGERLADAQIKAYRPSDIDAFLEVYR